MSRIDELIRESCPNGVPFRTLGEIGTLIRGNGMPKSDFTESGVGAIHYGQIYTYYGTWTTETISFVSSATAVKLAKVDPGDLIITNTSENVEDVGKAVAWLGDQQIVTGGHATVLKHQQDPKFLSYWLQTPEFHTQKTRRASGVKVIDVSAKQLATIKVPIPPVEVQREIVRVLDLFQTLETELEAELEARRRQYSHYRDQLLTFPEAGGVRWVPMRELGAWVGGVTPSKDVARYWNSGTIPWVTSMDISTTRGAEIRGRVTQAALDETSLRVVPGPSVAVVMRSNILRRYLPVGYVEVDAAANQDMRLLVPLKDINPRYAYQALLAASERIRTACVRTAGSMAAVDSKSFFEWAIPVPALEEQRRVVAILDKFDSLVNDLSIGLPAELAARRQQYAHYRDRLLTFQEAA